MREETKLHRRRYEPTNPHELRNWLAHTRFRFELNFEP